MTLLNCTVLAGKHAGKYVWKHNYKLKVVRDVVSVCSGKNFIVVITVWSAQNSYSVQFSRTFHYCNFILYYKLICAKVYIDNTERSFRQ